MIAFVPLVLNRFALYRELGVRCVLDFEISAAVYCDTVKNTFLRVEVIHEPSRETLPPDVFWLTRLFTCDASGDVTSNTPTTEFPNMTREEILKQYALATRAPEGARDIVQESVGV